MSPTPEEKRWHGVRLKLAIEASNFQRQTIADAVGRDVRTITNWTRGQNMPSEKEKVTLRRMLGPYDDPGDPVERAVRGSELLEWRQDTVIAFYKRNLHEQREGRAG